MDQRQLNLCIDAGNTRMKFGVFCQSELLCSGTGMPELEKAVSHYVISRAIICSVAETEAITAFLKQRKIPFVLLEQCGVPLEVNYETKATLGADRLALAVGAAFAFPGKNVLVVACGSCITYNFVCNGRSFEGGAISPGVHMRLRAMHQFTARLPLLKLEDVADVLGKSTPTSMLSGAVIGAAAEIDGMCERYSNKFPDLMIIVTGGDAPLLAAHLKNSIFARPALLLEGLNGILNHHA
ncbi:MAG: type III pantothenate kinase [Chitinophagales bacterium]